MTLFIDAIAKKTLVHGARPMHMFMLDKTYF